MSGYAHNATYQQLSTISEYFTSVDEKIFIDLRRGKGYTNEIEKLNRDDSNLSVRITLKNGTAKKKKKKKEIMGNWILSRQIFILTIKQWAHYELQRIQSKQTKKRNKLRTMRILKKPYLRNRGLILGNGKKHI